jgi:hypothetical protein
VQSQGLWAFRDEAWCGEDLTHFAVEALDGDVGIVADASDEIGRSYLVVDTGPWMFGKKVMLPAGVVARIDGSARKVVVNRTKDEIKKAPEYSQSAFTLDSQRAELSRYYGPRGPAQGGATAAVSKKAAEYTEAAFAHSDQPSDPARDFGRSGNPDANAAAAATRPTLAPEQTGEASFRWA